MSKIVIAGTRNLHPSMEDIDRALQAFCDFHPEVLPRGLNSISAVISGGATGVDECGERWAHHRLCPGWARPGHACSTKLAQARRCNAVVSFPADWRKHGNAAGPIRNREMALACDGALVFWARNSPGTASMVRILEERNIPRVVTVFDRGMEYR